MTSAQLITETFPSVCIIGSKAHDPRQVNQFSQVVNFFIVVPEVATNLEGCKSGVHCPLRGTRFVSPMTSCLIQLCHCSESNNRQNIKKNPI